MIEFDSLAPATTAADYLLAAIGVENAKLARSALTAGWMTDAEREVLAPLADAILHLAGPRAEGKPIAIESGCKVGWEIYDNERDAIEASMRAAAEGISKANRGYDFGYQTPGEIRHLDVCYSHHRNDDGTRDEYHNVWVVTIP